MAYKATVVKNHKTTSTHKCRTFDEALDKVCREMKGHYNFNIRIVLSDKDLENLPSTYGRIQSKGGK